MTRSRFQPSTDELIEWLQKGTAEQRCDAAYRLGVLGIKTPQVVSVLVSALSDMGEFSFSSAGWTGGAGNIRYVREEAVRALVAIDPSAAASHALQVIDELRDKPSSWYCGCGGESINYVSFGEDFLAKFESCLGQ